MESSLVLGLLSELFIATAKANVLRLAVIVFFEDFDIPPLQLLSGKFRFVSHITLEASRFLRFLLYALSAFAMSLMDELVDASARLVKDLDL